MCSKIIFLKEVASRTIIINNQITKTAYIVVVVNTGK